MEKFELQKPISQLFNALAKSHFFACECFQIDGSEQLKKSHNFGQIIVVMSSLRNSINGQ